MSKRDYYDVLGVSKSASDQELKSAYRKLARKYHPDVSQEQDAEVKFKEVNEAYETLSDSQKRTQYDQFGHEGPQGFGGGGFSGGFDDFDLGDIFGSFFGGGGSRNPNAPRQGQDLQMYMDITFDEACFGVKKKITVDSIEECIYCNGSGARTKSDIITCSTCNGTGQTVQNQRTIFGTQQVRTTCPTCKGKGKQIKNSCQTCKGKGTTVKKKDIDVKVPPGVDDGTKLVMEGYGREGKNGGPNGDLYLVFRISRHNYFERNGSDLYLEVPISYAQASMGDVLSMPTIHGEVKFKVPAGTQSGTKLRLKDKGIKKLHGRGMGDLYVILNIKTHQKLSSEEKKILDRLLKIEKDSGKSPFDNFRKNFK